MVPGTAPEAPSRKAQKLSELEEVRAARAEAKAARKQAAIDAVEAVRAGEEAAAAAALDAKRGERKERTEWHRVVIYNENLAKVAEQYLRKGSKIYLEGQLQTRKFADRDGAEKYTTEVVLTRFRGELVMLDRSGGEGAERVPAMAGAGAGGGDRSFQRDELDDEIPF